MRSSERERARAHERTSEREMRSSKACYPSLASALKGGGLKRDREERGETER